MKQYSKEEIQNQLQNILSKHSSTQSHIESQKLDDIPTIEMKVYSFDVLGSKLYVITRSDHRPYIQEYIDSINNGSPDKDRVIRKYAIEYQKMSESLIDRMLDQVGSPQSGYTSLPIGIISELNKIELDLKPLLDAQKRDQKIDNLLHGGIQENEE
jgi:hypothetical protein